MTFPLLFTLLALSSTHAQGLFDLQPHRPKIPLNRLADPSNWMAIVGDSGTTGAASNKAMEAEIWNLLSHVVAFGYDSQRTVTIPPLTDFPYPERFLIESIDPMTRVSLNSIP